MGVHELYPYIYSLPTADTSKMPSRNKKTSDPLHLSKHIRVVSNTESQLF